MTKILYIAIACFLVTLSVVLVGMRIPYFRNYSTRMMFGALEDNHADEVRKWCTLGADVNATNSNAELASHRDESPLQIAFRNGNYSLLGLLIEYGANPNCKFVGGSAYLFEMLGAKDLRVFVEGGADWWPQREVLMKGAVASNDVELVNYLAVLGCNFEECVENVKSLECLKALVEAGIKIQKHKATLLRCAINEGDSELLAYLLQAGCDPNTPHGGDFMSPLFQAAESNRNTMCLQLIKAGANPNAGEGGYTPMHVAAYADSDRALYVLLQNGGRLDMKGSNGKTPEQMAGPKCRRYLELRSKLTQGSR